MRFRSTISITTIVCALIFFSTGFAGAVSLSEYVLAPEEMGAMQFDAHDLTGLWVRSGGSGGIGPGASRPPLTPDGTAKMSGRVGTGDVPLPVYSKDPKYR